MSKSDTIRALRQEGLEVAEIARRVGVRYQFVRNVLLRSGLLPSSIAAESKKTQSATQPKPRLSTDALLQAGFVHSGRWALKVDGGLVLERPLPKAAGVYAMAKDGFAQYVGLATMGIAKRFYFYCKPGPTQRTSIRVNELLRRELETSQIDIYTATPKELSWNGLPVSGTAGLELGLIEGYQLPWNIRGVKR